VFSQAIFAPQQNCNKGPGFQQVLNHKSLELYFDLRSRIEAKVKWALDARRNLRTGQGGIMTMRLQETNNDCSWYWRRTYSNPDDDGSIDRAQHRTQPVGKAQFRVLIGPTPASY
jgi:hypothetical protein